MPSATAEPLISIADAAKLLAVDRMRVHYLIETGELSAYTLPPMLGRNGTKRYVPKSQVERLLASRGD